MECASSASVEDLDSLSDDDEVALLAERVERQMELPTVSESIPVPTSSSEQEENRAGTPRLSYIPGPMFNAGYFDLGMGRGPVARDPRLRNDHPINICSQLIPMVDTPMSPPAVDKYPTGDWRAVTETTTNNNQQCPSGIHFRGPSGDDNAYITGCADCLICRKICRADPRRGGNRLLAQNSHSGGSSRTIQCQETSVLRRDESRLPHANPRGSVLGVRL